MIFVGGKSGMRASVFGVGSFDVGRSVNGRYLAPLLGEMRSGR